jgi:hypothetical protein
MEDSAFIIPKSALEAPAVVPDAVPSTAAPLEDLCAPEGVINSSPSIVRTSFWNNSFWSIKDSSSSVMMVLW